MLVIPLLRPAASRGTTMVSMIYKAQNSQVQSVLEPFFRSSTNIRHQATKRGCDFVLMCPEA